MQAIPQSQMEQMQIIVQIVQKKMKFDPRNNLDELHDDETYFKEFREYLDIIFKSVTFLCPEMVVQLVAQRIAQIDQIADPLEKEVCIHMFYLLSEGMPGAPIFQIFFYPPPLFFFFKGLIPIITKIPEHRPHLSLRKRLRG